MYIHIYMCTYIHRTIKEKEAIDLKVNKGERSK